MDRVDPLHDYRPIRLDDLCELSVRPRPEASTVLAYDVYKAGDELVIEFDVPGVDPSQIEVALENRVLRVSVRRELAHGAGIDVIETGRAHGEFTQQLLLGGRWDPSRVRARVEHGVLCIRAPVAHPHRRVVALDAETGIDADSAASWVGDEAGTPVSSAA